MTCWDRYGERAPITPEVRDAAAAVARVYEFSSVGGNLHVAIDDWNVEDDTLDFCERAIAENVRGDGLEQLAAERECLRRLRALTVRERASALAINDGYVKP